MVAWFEGLPEVSDTQVGAWGISYGGGQTWNGLAAGIPYKAAEVVETWTDLFSALWPQDIAKSGIVARLRQVGRRALAADRRLESDAIHSTNMPALQGDRRCAVVVRGAPEDRRRPSTCSRAVSTMRSTSRRR